jgi:Helix-loop-helix DNA-binding domain
VLLSPGLDSYSPTLVDSRSSPALTSYTGKTFITLPIPSPGFTTYTGQRFSAPFNSSPATPPTIQHRREAHIRSEQKRRESINGGFADLHNTLTSQQLERALTLSSHNDLSEVDTDIKSTTSFRDNRRNSKSVLLQKAAEAIDHLSKYAIEQHARNAELRKNKVLQSKNRNVEFGVPLDNLDLKVGHAGADIKLDSPRETYTAPSDAEIRTIAMMNTPIGTATAELVLKYPSHAMKVLEDNYVQIVSYVMSFEGCFEYLDFLAGYDVLPTASSFVEDEDRDFFTGSIKLF